MGDSRQTDSDSKRKPTDELPLSFDPNARNDLMAKSRDARPPEPEAVLVVDDDDDIRLVIEKALEDDDRTIRTVGTAAEARAEIMETDFDVVITDLTMPDEDGISLMQWAQEQYPGPNWVILTGHASLDAAVKALQLGAFDFLSKPLMGMAPLRNAVQNAITHQRLLNERDRLHAELQVSNSRLREHVERLEDACGLLEEQSDTIKADLRRAGLIQHALLPREAPELEGFRVESIYRPCASVGGDLYDLVPLDDRHVAIVIADAAGHGLSAAMLAVMFRSQLTLMRRDGSAPRRTSDALSLVNSSLCEGLTAPGLFVTAACCLLDTVSGDVQIASAGHTPITIQRADGEFEQVFHTGPALGLYPKAVFAEHSLTLHEGDRLLLHTDGLHDIIEASDETPGECVARAMGAATQGDTKVLQELFGAALATTESEDASGHEDDVTLVLLDLGKGSSSIDNGLPPTLPTPVMATESAEVLHGSDGDRAAVSIRGRAEWAASAAFHERCLEYIQAGRSLLLDLTLCTYMDSTFLGTVHQLAEEAREARVEMRIQGLMPPVQELFEELGMSLVLDHVLPSMLPLPVHMSPMSDESSVGRTVSMLRAHESLANLNEKNRREFGPLLDLLRKESEPTT